MEDAMVDMMFENYYGDINWDLVDERKTWVSKEKIWTNDGVRVMSKDAMVEDTEYVIF